VTAFRGGGRIFDSPVDSHGGGIPWTVWTRAFVMYGGLMEMQRHRPAAYRDV
jgi:hypothetical protein